MDQDGATDNGDQVAEEVTVDQPAEEGMGADAAPEAGEPAAE
ncbi:MAG TPA: hypothetical protein VEA36_00735 [Candidatus Paceibacterota bacterium]|nr:hypothetical protein [Candidatus Paceibacterota bacterium]